MLTDEQIELRDSIVGELLAELSFAANRPKMPPEIAKAIVEIEKEIQILGKDAKADMGDRKQVAYVSVDQFFEEVGRRMGAHGIFSIGFEKKSEVVQRQGKYGLTNWLAVSYDFVLYHESGAEFGPISREIQVIASGPQAYGAAQSYLEKQFLRALFKIPTYEKEPDVDAHDQVGLPEDRRQVAPKREKPPKYSEEESAAARERMLKEIAAIPMIERDLMHWANVNNAETERMLDPDEEIVSQAYFAKQAAIRGKPKSEKGAPF